MDSNFTKRWMQKFRIITLSLVFSGALNIGLIAAFIAMILQERSNSLIPTALRPIEKVQEITNEALLQQYSNLSFRELCSHLTNTDLVEDGILKRDLALASLVSFHDFNLEKAIGRIPSQKRSLKCNDRTCEFFPALSDDEYKAILQYAYLEKWPLTASGLFKVLQKSSLPRDPSLIQAFCLTNEFDAVKTLFQKSSAPLEENQIIDLLCEGNWQILDGFVREQAQMLDLSVERRRRFVLSYLALQSFSAVNILLQTDFTFALKRLNDAGIVDLLSHAQPNETLQKFCMELLQSTRSDIIHEKSTGILYRMANEEMPHPFNRSLAIQRFIPHSTPIASTELKEKKKSSAPSERAKIYTVQEGDNLWKIAKRFRVSVNDLMASNHLAQNKIKPKMQLKIPETSAAQGTGSCPPQ